VIGPAIAVVSRMLANWQRARHTVIAMIVLNMASIHLVFGFCYSLPTVFSVSTSQSTTVSEMVVAAADIRVANSFDLVFFMAVVLV
jgi:hypothetical protein